MNRNIEIWVRERIEIDAGGTARCRRTYTFFNRTSQGLKIDRVLDVSLPKHIKFENAYFDDRASQPHEEREAYQAKLIIFLKQADLQPRSQTSLSIEYRWPGFLPSGNEPSYFREVIVRHNFAFQFEFEISSADPGLLGNPAFNISPRESRLPGRQVIPTADEHSFLVRTGSVPPKTDLTISISGGQGGVSELPVLTELGNEFYSEAPFREVTVFFIQHLLHDFEVLIRAFVRAGLRPENTFIVGIPYSTKDPVVHRLRARYNAVIAPESYPFPDEVRSALIAAHKQAEQRGKRFLVVEDGGYVASLMRDDPDGSLWASRCAGIVEQTRNGIWATQYWQEHQDRYLNPLWAPSRFVLELILARSPA